MLQLHWEMRAETSERGGEVVTVYVKAAQWQEAVYVCERGEGGARVKGSVGGNMVSC